MSAPPQAGPPAASGGGWRSRVARAAGLDVVGARWRKLPRLARTIVPAVVMLALAVLYPFYRDSLPSLPIVGAFPLVNSAVTMLVFATMAIGLNVVVGYAGLLDLGYVAFYAIGAYTVALLASPTLGTFANAYLAPIGLNHEVPIPGVHINVWLLLIAAAVITAILGIIIGLPTLRLRGDYLAIVTLGFGEIIYQVANNGDDIFGKNITNGAAGATPVDGLGFGKALEDAVGLPATFVADPHSERLYYWTALAILMFAIIACSMIRDSRMGRAWIAIREDEVAASAMGIPLMRTKTWAYAIGAFFGGIAGGFYASFKSSAFPSDFLFQLSVLFLAMVILGGMGRIAGVLVGGLFLAYLHIEGLANIGAKINESFGTNIDVPKYEFGIFGAILVITMLFRPQGLIPEARRKAEFAGQDVAPE